jgi:hypothetical protein
MALPVHTLKPHIFPTGFREKIGKDFAFAAGAEVLSRALDGIAQHSLLSCSFFGSQDHALRHADELLICQITYAKRGRTFHDAQSANDTGVFDAKWSIIMRVIPIADRAAVRQLLMETGLPKLVRPWFDRHAHLTGQNGEACLDILYHRTNGELTSAERMKLEPRK